MLQLVVHQRSARPEGSGRCEVPRTPLETLVESTPIFMRSNGDKGALFETAEAVVSGSAVWHPGRSDGNAQQHIVCHTRHVDPCRAGIFALPWLRFRARRHGRCGTSEEVAGEVGKCLLESSNSLMTV